MKYIFTLYFVQQTILIYNFVCNQLMGMQCWISYKKKKTVNKKGQKQEGLCHAASDFVNHNFVKLILMS